jgi:uncharacterized repeat protein (TIGR03803 family)
VIVIRPNSGSEIVEYAFSGSDGRTPQSLINVSGTLYGVTVYGGAANGGTVFSLTP